MNATRSIIALASVLLALVPPVAAGEEGQAEWVAPRVLGTPPEQVTREVDIGTGLNDKEDIDTSERGAVDIVFLDNSRLLVGPRCSIKLNTSVLSPLTGREERAPSITTRTRCLVRADAMVDSSFLHDVVAGAENVFTLQTPIAIIHIVGADAVVELRTGDLAQLQGSGDSGVLPTTPKTVSVIKLSEAGRVVVQMGAEQRSLTAAGTMLRKASVQAGLGQPTPIAAAELGGLLAEFEGLRAPLPLSVDVVVTAPVGNVPRSEPRLGNPCLDTAACDATNDERLRRAFEPRPPKQPPCFPSCIGRFPPD